MVALARIVSIVGDAGVCLTMEVATYDVVVVAVVLEVGISTDLLSFLALFCLDSDGDEGEGDEVDEEEAREETRPFFTPDFEFDF